MLLSSEDFTTIAIKMNQKSDVEESENNIQQFAVTSQNYCYLHCLLVWVSLLSSLSVGVGSTELVDAINIS